MRAGRAAAFVLFCFAWVVPEASAHLFAPALLELRETTPDHFAVRWKQPAMRAQGTFLQPVLPLGCKGAGKPSFTSDPANLSAGAVAQWEISCEGGIVEKTLAVEGLDASQTSALVRISFADGRGIRHVLTGAAPSFTVPDREDRPRIALSYGQLGVEHIATGWDHLAFVLGLIVLVVGRRRLLATVTAFTLGHSVTLALAVLGVVRVPQELTEAAIALSIFVLATELARTAMGAEPSILSTKPWAMAGPFGLLHGLGFAGALSNIGLPAGEIPLALFSFNVGIELGQLAFIAVVLSGWALLRRVPVVAALPSSAARFVPAYAIGTIAAFWCIERTWLATTAWRAGGGQ